MSFQFSLRYPTSNNKMNETSRQSSLNGIKCSSVAGRPLLDANRRRKTINTPSFVHFNFTYKPSTLISLKFQYSLAIIHWFILDLLQELSYISISSLRLPLFLYFPSIFQRNGKDLKSGSAKRKTICFATGY